MKSLFSCYLFVQSSRWRIIHIYIQHQPYGKRKRTKKLIATSQDTLLEWIFAKIFLFLPPFCPPSFPSHCLHSIISFAMCYNVRRNVEVFPTPNTASYPLAVYSIRAFVKQKNHTLPFLIYTMFLVYYLIVLLNLPYTLSFRQPCRILSTMYGLRITWSSSTEA